MSNIPPPANTIAARHAAILNEPPQYVVNEGGVTVNTGLVLSHWSQAKIFAADPNVDVVLVPFSIDPAISEFASRGEFKNPNRGDYRGQVTFTGDNVDALTTRIKAKPLKSITRQDKKNWSGSRLRREEQERARNRLTRESLEEGICSKLRGLIGDFNAALLSATPGDMSHRDVNNTFGYKRMNQRQINYYAMHRDGSPLGTQTTQMFLQLVKGANQMPLIVHPGVRGGMGPDDITKDTELRVPFGYAAIFRHVPGIPKDDPRLDAAGVAAGHSNNWGRVDRLLGQVNRPLALGNGS